VADFQAIDRYLAENRQTHLEELMELLRVPTISADPGKSQEMDRGAEWVANYFKRLGLKSEIIKGNGPSLVYAETPPIPGGTTVLVYGHYDVQPVDPLNLWDSDPFSPEIRHGNIYARGATDDKGQMLTHLQSLSAWYATGQKPDKVQVKYLIEGEEEKGSEVLHEALPGLKEKLACDVIVISDSSQYAAGRPAITYGLRGIAYFELHVYGPKVDLHSGSFGGAVNNPALALARLLTEIKDHDGRIQLPGFYDSVVPLQESERDMWKSLNFSDEKFSQQLGVDGLIGEKGYTTLERRWARPTFDVHGLFGGYQGEGGKTIIPAKAGAKISFRLVPNQDPQTVAKQLREFVASHTPPGVRIEVVDLHGGEGVVVDPNSIYMRGAEKAVEEGFEAKPVLIREGGSIPIVADMVKLLNCDCLLMGLGLDDDGAHSPNEKFKLDDYYRGIKASSRLWEYLARRVH
jgi:acetylornithine deacetylase/succinyl-diaminopimelate desuccinylase-like protein